MSLTGLPPPTSRARRSTICVPSSLLSLHAHIGFHSKSPSAMRKIYGLPIIIIISLLVANGRVQPQIMSSDIYTQSAPSSRRAISTGWLPTESSLPDRECQIGRSRPGIRKIPRVLGKIEILGEGFRRSIDNGSKIMSVSQSVAYSKFSCLIFSCIAWPQIPMQLKMLPLPPNMARSTNANSVIWDD